MYCDVDVDDDGMTLYYLSSSRHNFSLQQMNHITFVTEDTYLSSL